MFARIDHERTVREGLEQQRQELLKRKQKLIADNKRRKDDLANLDNDLEKFIDVRPAQLPPPGSTLTLSIGRETHPEALREGGLRMVTWRHELFSPLQGQNSPRPFNIEACVSSYRRRRLGLENNTTGLEIARHVPRIRQENQVADGMAMPENCIFSWTPQRTEEEGH